jgi:hypothetical protein
MANSKAIGVAYEDQKIVGGTVDNTVIGGTTAAAGTFTSLTATGDVALGNAAGDLIGFHGATAVDQAAFVATLSINALSVSGVIGYTTSASFSAHATAINSILACLIEKGLMAAS